MISATLHRSQSYRHSLALVATSVGFAVVQLDVSVVNVAIKPIGASLGGGITALQWIISAYTLSFAAFILTAGTLGDRIGAKRLFMTGFMIFTVASACCGLAPNIATLVAARALQGMGAAILVPCSLSILSHTYKVAAERTRAVGLWAAGASAALAGGPLVGGLLTATLGWRAIFFINAPIGLIGLWLTWKYVDETTRSTKRGIDIRGQIAAIISLGSLAWSTITGGAHGFDHRNVLIGYGVFLAVLLVFIVFEKRQKDPMLPLGLFHSSIFSAMSIIGLLINISFYGLIFILSLFFQQGQQLTVLQAGLAFAPMTAAVLAGNVTAAKIACITSRGWVIKCGTALMAAGGLGLLSVHTSTPYVALLVQLLAIGLGLGLIVPIVTVSLLSSMPMTLSGVASGVLNSSRQVGSVIGVAVFGALVANGRLLHGMREAIIVLIVLSVCSALLITLRERSAK